MMKKLFTILILIFTLQTQSQADDIQDFQIEGMSIGDSLLDYFDEKKIKTHLRNTPFKDNTFILYEFRKDSKFETYDWVQFYVKPNDKNYTIYSIGGLIDYPNKFSECKKKQNKILSELSGLFDNEKGVKKSNIKTFTHSADSKSTLRQALYFFPNGDEVEVTCGDYSDITGWPDDLRVSINLKEFADYLYGGQ